MRKLPFRLNYGKEIAAKRTVNTVSMTMLMAALVKGDYEVNYLEILTEVITTLAFHLSAGFQSGSKNRRRRLNCTWWNLGFRQTPRWHREKIP